MKREFTVVVEQGDRYLMPGAHSQAETLDELLANMREVIELCLEEVGEDQAPTETRLIGLHRVAV
jgi:predicted RNase H-like HicB family nuclease